jgi:16S rRNA (adenine(1408)-N(1))-methyltransferase
METIRGKTSQELDFNGFAERIAGYNRIFLDIGTGDGRYVRTLAEGHPDWFVIGLDACRENLREHSRVIMPNMLFVIASAQDLPGELSGLISDVTINFPWGSLLESLLAGDPKLINGLASLARPAASIALHLNGGALAEAGWSIEGGVNEIYNKMLQASWRVKAPVPMDAQALRSFPSTWAKRLAFGRDPRAIVLNGFLSRE